MSRQVQQQKQSQRRLKARLEIYQTFQNNSSYQERSGKLKQVILNSDNQILLHTVCCLKNLLTYRHLHSFQDLLKVQNLEFLQKNTNPEQEIQLSEYSMLLALRFIRELYFQSFYPFILLINLQLEHIFQKLASFGSQSDEQQRGRLIFIQSKPPIFVLLNNKASKLSKTQLERIGFSVHKFVLQILKKSASVYKLIPFHEQFCLRNLQSYGPFFQIPFYKLYKRLLNRKIKFPSIYHYFKSDEHISFISKYKTIDGAKHVQLFYFFIFEEIWAILSKQVQRGLSSNELLHIYGSIKCGQFQDLNNAVEQIGGETNDRYFWAYLDLFLKKMLKTLSQLQEQKQKITFKSKYFHFIGLFAQILRNCEILAYIQKEHISNIYQFFIYLLRYVHQLEQEGNQMRKNQKMKSQEYPSAIKVAFNLLNLFDMLEKILVLNKNTLQQPNLFERLSIYLKVLGKVSVKQQITQAQCSLAYKPKQNSSQKNIQIQKHKFLTKYHLLPEEKLSPYQKSDLQQRIKLQIDGLFRLGYKTFQLKMCNAKNQAQLQILSSSANQLLLTEQAVIQEIKMPTDEVSEIQIQSVIKGVNSLKGTPFQRKSCYQLSRRNTYSQNFSSQKSIKIASQSCSKKEFATPQKYSFKQSLKINLNRVSSQSIKSLSTKRKNIVRNTAQKMIILDGPLTSKIQVSDWTEEKMLILGGPLVSKIQVSDWTEEFDFNQSQAPSIQPIKTIDSRCLQLKKVSTRDRQQQIEQKQTNQQKINSFMSNKALNKINSSQDNSSRQEIAQPQHENSKQFEKNEKGSLQQRKQLESQQTLPLQSVSPKQCLFCFSLKTKKDLLKNRCLLKKTSNIEIGLSTTFYQQAILSRNGMSRHNSIVSIYLTAINQLQKLEAIIDFPPWITLLETHNIKIQKLHTQSQQVMKFKVSPSIRGRSIENHNFGKLPTMHLKFEYLGQSYVQYLDIPFLITKFTIQHRVTNNQIDELLRSDLILLQVNKRIATQMHQIKHLFPSTLIIDSQKLSSYKRLPSSICDCEILGLLKMQFLLNKLCFYVVFQEKRLEVDKRANRLLFFDLLTLNRNKLHQDQLHMVKACFKSILAA